LELQQVYLLGLLSLHLLILHSLENKQYIKGRRTE